MHLTKKQAYMAMFYYLENLYQLTGSDDLGGFLGGMVILDDKSPADPAVMSDWEKALNKALKEFPEDENN